MAEAKYEWYNTTSAVDNNYPPYAVGQNFTVGSTGTNENFAISKIVLALWRDGSPGTLTFNLYAVDGDGKPTGSSLSSGTIDGNGLPTSAADQTITMSPAAVLSASTKYALCITGGVNSTNHYIVYKNDTGTYSGGNYIYSSDSGASWTVATNTDLDFEVWGNKVVTGTNMHVQVGDVFRPVSEIHINVGDIWRPATALVNINDVWRA